MGGLEPNDVFILPLDPCVRGTKHNLARTLPRIDVFVFLMDLRCRAERYGIIKYDAELSVWVRLNTVPTSICFFYVQIDQRSMTLACSQSYFHQDMLCGLDWMLAWNPPFPLDGFVVRSCHLSCYP